MVQRQPPLFKSGEEQPATPRQARSRDRRARILTAAMELFAERGYHATGIAEIASRADAAAGAFYLYFPSKRQLLIALMNDLVEKLSRLELKPKPREGARAGLRAFLAAALQADRKYYGVIRAWQEAAHTDAELAEMQRKLETWTQSRILRVFQALQQHANARPAQDLPAFARMMDRHFWSLLARGAQLSQRDFNRQVRLAADVIYHFLFQDAPPDADAKIG